MPSSTVIAEKRSDQENRTVEDFGNNHTRVVVIILFAIRKFLVLNFCKMPNRPTGRYTRGKYFHGQIKDQGSKAFGRKSDRKKEKGAESESAGSGPGNGF